MYTQAVEFGAQIAKQTSKNGASVVEAGAQAGEDVRDMFGKKDEGLLDKIGNFIAGGGLVGMGAKFGESLRNKILN